MGCFLCKASNVDKRDHDARNEKYKEAQWKADEPLLESKLRSMREEFWDTQPHYGGDKGRKLGRLAVVAGKNVVTMVVLERGKVRSVVRSQDVPTLASLADSIPQAPASPAAQSCPPVVGLCLCV